MSCTCASLRPCRLKSFRFHSKVGRCVKVSFDGAKLRVSEYWSTAKQVTIDPLLGTPCTRERMVAIAGILMFLPQASHGHGTSQSKIVPNTVETEACMCVCWLMVHEAECGLCMPDGLAPCLQYQAVRPIAACAGYDPYGCRVWAQNKTRFLEAPGRLLPS